MGKSPTTVYWKWNIWNGALMVIAHLWKGWKYKITMKLYNFFKQKLCGSIQSQVYWIASVWMIMWSQEQIKSSKKAPTLLFHCWVYIMTKSIIQIHRNSNQNDLTQRTQPAKAKWIAQIMHSAMGHGIALECVLERCKRKWDCCWCWSNFDLTSNRIWWAKSLNSIQRHLLLLQRRIFGCGR